MPRSRDDVVAHQRLKIESLLNLDLLGLGSFALSGVRASLSTDRIASVRSVMAPSFTSISAKRESDTIGIQ